MERYKAMAGSKGKPFTLQYCWKLLEHVDKWKLRGQEAPPKKGALLQLDGASDEENGGRNKGKPDGNKKAKEKIKLEAEASSLAHKIVEFVKSKETMTIKALEAKMIMNDKKNAIKQARWKAFRNLEERKIALEEKKAMSGAHCRRE
jgi:hypothetical protein